LLSDIQPWWLASSTRKSSIGCSS